MTDGLLEVAVFPRLGRLQLLGVLLEIWLRGRPRTPPWIRRGQIVRISSSERMPIHADGQIAGRLPVTVRCRVGALRVFA
jgi:diacylglycerol kinase family enzyme